MKPPLQELVGRRFEICVVEPSEFARRGLDTWQGKILKVIRPRNAVGDSYDLALAFLDQPFDWDPEIYRMAVSPFRSSVASLMSQNTTDSLEDMLHGRRPLVHFGLEHERILELDPLDPQFRTVEGRYVGFGPARLL